MLFIFPMWDNESQRLGKKRCTPVGYALDGIAQLAGFLSLIAILIWFVYLIYRLVVGSFEWSLLLFIPAVFAVGIICQILYNLSWRLAYKRSFRYDYDLREASWQEGDRRVTFKSTDLKG